MPFVKQGMFMPLDVLDGAYHANSKITSDQGVKHHNLA